MLVPGSTPIAAVLLEVPDFSEEVLPTIGSSLDDAAAPDGSSGLEPVDRQHPHLVLADPVNADLQAALLASSGSDAGDQTYRHHTSTDPEPVQKMYLLGGGLKPLRWHCLFHRQPPRMRAFPFLDTGGAGWSQAAAGEERFLHRPPRKLCVVSWAQEVLFL